jgi:hypothetical protein
MPIIRKSKNNKEPIYEDPVPYRSPVYEAPVAYRSPHIYEKPDKCKPNDYKCKFESCEKQRIQERPLPPIPMRKSSGEYARVEGEYDNVRGDEGRRMLNLNNELGETTTGGGKKRRSTTRRRRRNSKTKSKSKSRSSRKKRVKKTRKHGKYINKKIISGGNRSSKDIIEDFNSKSNDKKCNILAKIRMPICNNEVSNFEFNNVNTFKDENPYGDVAGVEEDPETKCNRQPDMRWCKNRDGDKCVSKNMLCLNHKVLAAPTTVRRPSNSRRY